MRTRMIATLFVLTGTLGSPACDKKDDANREEAKATAKKDEKKADVKADVKVDAKTEPAAEGGAADGADAKVEPAAMSSIELPDLGLKAQAPAETSVGKSELEDALMIQGENGWAATVELASDDRPKTEQEAKKSVDSLRPKNFVGEKLEDGFAVTFDNEGGLGANYFVNVRREIGGKSYWCETTGSSAEQQAIALAFCKSLSQ